LRWLLLRVPRVSSLRVCIRVVLIALGRNVVMLVVIVLVEVVSRKWYSRLVGIVTCWVLIPLLIIRVISLLAWMRMTRRPLRDLFWWFFPLLVWNVGALSPNLSLLSLLEELLLLLEDALRHIWFFLSLSSIP